MRRSQTISLDANGVQGWTRRLLETVLSIATLAGLLWVARVLVPRAAREEDRFALACAVAALILAIVLWLLVGVTRVS